ncbi:hypothetical protein EXD81_19630 [Bacillus amyloliquefaciens]|nr:hypothetical protein EXD81_19630 [Bacillus amyloliquefaciens]
MINEQGARSYIYWSCYAAQEVRGGQHGGNSVMMQKPFLRCENDDILPAAFQAGRVSLIFNKIRRFFFSGMQVCLSAFIIHIRPLVG